MMRKKKGNIVYSTNKEFEYYEDIEEKETLSPEKQVLKVWFERKHRAGKKVTLISGFVGTKEDSKALEKLLKAKCGVGGSSKDGIILIQGDLKDKVKEILKIEGYMVKG